MQTSAAAARRRHRLLHGQDPLATAKGVLAEATAAGEALRLTTARLRLALARLDLLASIEKQCGVRIPEAFWGSRSLRSLNHLLDVAKG